MLLLSYCCNCATLRHATARNDGHAVVAGPHVDEHGVLAPPGGAFGGMAFPRALPSLPQPITQHAADTRSFLADGHRGKANTCCSSVSLNTSVRRSSGVRSARLHLVVQNLYNSAAYKKPEKAYTQFCFGGQVNLYQV